MALSQTFEHCGEMEHARCFRRELELDDRLKGLYSHHLVMVWFGFFFGLRLLVGSGLDQV